jgi:hypothetical protein
LEKIDKNLEGTIIANANYDNNRFLQRTQYWIVENGELKRILTKPTKIKVGDMILYKE